MPGDMVRIKTGMSDGTPEIGVRELAAAIRDTPIVCEPSAYDENIGAYVATAMLPEELAAVLLDKAWLAAQATGTEG